MNRLRKDMELALSPLMLEAGFRKKELTWCLTSPEIIRVLHMQKSAYGNDFYLRLGVFLRALEPDKTWVTEVDCHGRFGLPEGLSKEEGRRFDEALRDFDPLELNGWKFSAIIEVIGKHAIPFLKTLDTEAAVYECLFKRGIIFYADGKTYLESKFHHAI